MSSWDDVLKSVGTGAAGLAAQLWGGYADQARSDAQNFVASSRDDIQKWADQVKQGQITVDDFTANVQMEADIAELAALTEVLVAQEQLQRFRDQLTALIVTTVRSALP